MPKDEGRGVKQEQECVNNAGGWFAIVQQRLEEVLEVMG